MRASPAVLWAETTVRNLGPAPEDTRTSVIHTTVVPAARPHLHHLLRQHYHPAVPWVETTVRSLARAQADILALDDHTIAILAVRQPPRLRHQHHRQHHRQHQHRLHH